MSQELIENTKALNRLTNTLLTIFRMQAGETPVEKPAKPAPAAKEEAKAPASTTEAPKTQPAAAPPAPAAPAAIPMVRESASRLTLHLAGSTAEGQGRQVAVDLLAEYQDAEGDPCKGAKSLQESDIPVYLKRVIGIIGEDKARAVLGVK